MGTSIATARAALDILRASATVLSPAHTTGILRGTETLHVLHALHADLAAVLEEHQAPATQASSNAVASVLVHPHLFPSLLEWLVIDASSRAADNWVPWGRSASIGEM